MPDFLVLFNTTNAYVIKKDIEKYRGFPNVLINPDLSAVDSEDTIFWKPKGNKVVPLVGKKREARLKKVSESGRDFRIEKFYRFHPHLNILAIAAATTILLMAVHYVRS